MLRTLSCRLFCALYFVIALVNPSGFADEKFDQDYIHVTASYAAASTASTNENADDGDLKIAKDVARAVAHYQNELPHWWGIDTKYELSAFTVTAKRGPEISETGTTAFTFENGEVFNWVMHVEGDKELITGVVAHEMNHVFFAKHFLRPLPRALDEGAAQKVETKAYHEKAYRNLVAAAQNGEIFSFKEMLSQMTYPVGKDKEDTERLTHIFYPQSLFLVNELLERGDRPTFIRFLQAGCRYDDFGKALFETYGITADEFSTQCNMSLRKLAKTNRSFLILKFKPAS